MKEVNHVIITVVYIDIGPWGGHFKKQKGLFLLMTGLKNVQETKLTADGLIPEMKYQLEPLDF